MSGRVPPAAARLVALAALLAPARRRAAWHRQWVAELEHRCADRGPGGATRFALGAIPHALYLRREEARVTGILAEVRHTARGLLRRPGFSLLTIATLAVGIGAATAVFSLAEALLLRPLPLEHNDRLVRIFSTNARRGTSAFSVSHPDYVDLTARSGLFESASFYDDQSRDVSSAGDPERVHATAVAEDFFQTLGSPTYLGRTFTAEDHDPRSEATVVLARSFWEGRFGADSTALGTSVRIDGAPHTVIGIVSDAVAWPAGARVWTPLQWGDVVPEGIARRSNHSWQVIGRLRPGIDVAAARVRVAEIADAIYSAPDIDARDVGTSAVVTPLHASGGGGGSRPLFTTLGAAVLMVLLIACMNASGLLLVRAWSRERELSLRAALGAGRIRLALILLGESAVLALVGGALGVALGVLGLERAFRHAPPAITVLGDPQLNLAVVGAGAGISLVAALLAGLVPACRASRLSVSESLKEGSGRAGASRAGTRLRQGLVVTELAFSLALLTGAALTVRGFQRQIAADPGFDADGLLSFTVRLPGTRYGDEALVNAYFRDAIERLERLPGIVFATATSRLPLGAGGSSLTRAFIFDGATPPPEGAAFGAAWIEVDADWFEALGIAPREGRAFTADDSGDAPLVAIVNERMASLMSPSEPIVGRRIRSTYDENLPRTVVGVIPDFQVNGVSRAQRNPVVLVPRRQAVRTSMAFLVRTTRDPSEAIPAVRRTMAELDGDVALDALQTLREAHAADLAGIRFLTTLFAAFGLLALVLSVSGVYGLVSTSVTQRTREIGVRMAMGASTGTVRAAVVRESALLALIGLTIGLGLAYGAGRVLAVGMDGIAVPEPSTYVTATLILTAAVIAASWVPAVRATRVDPVEALRSD